MKHLITILLLGAATALGQIDNPPTSTSILDATAVGRAVLTASNAAAARSAIEVELTNLSSTPTLTALTNTGNTVLGGTLTITGNVTMSGTGNTAPNQTAASGASVITRDLGDARFAPMPWTVNIVPWFYDGTTGVTRVINGSGTAPTNAFEVGLTTTTNANDSTVVVFANSVFGSLDTGTYPMRNSGSGLIIQGRINPSRTNSVSRYVYTSAPSATNLAATITNIGTNGIINNGWAVEAKADGATTDLRLIVYGGPTNITASAWTPYSSGQGNDNSIMVIPGISETKLYHSSGAGTAMTREPLITVTNVPGGTNAGAAAVFGIALINTNTAGANPSIYIRRVYQALNMDDFGY